MSRPVSVLMAVYAGDRADWVRAALQSLQDQTHPAEQVVVVEDGPIPADVSTALDDFSAALPIERVTLPANRGLSHALQEGLAHCRFEFVARMDSDDLAVPQRFRRQADVLEARPELSALGGYVTEFTDDPSVPYAVREVPVGTAKVRKVARWRSPVNHPAVMFRRDDVRAVGGYGAFTGLEDYYLWAKLLTAGHQIDNLPEVLVQQRAGADLGRRRGGWRYAAQEIRLFREFVRMGFLSVPHAVAGLALRLPVRLVPRLLRSGVYRHALRRRLER